ncbi:alkanesulfonate monooxygenase [Exophiala viscosa]|uniref:alkanesulfonate monooxygenase n=1 Tax=Exophiala viscosa TaxID=2486360 RepID=UPI002191E89F|nr:alkanesulfonate monooxygenase [Exophiala viscosa]
MAQNHISATTNGENVEKKKKMILNAFVMNSPGHLATGFWKHPRNKTTEYTKLKFWTDLAQMLDKAGFHALFVADVLGAYDIYKGPGNHGPVTSAGAQFPINDPLYTVPAMAAVTKNLTFGITASTTYEAPYALARRFSTVDHLSEGRVAWNIVTSYLESAARNFGLSTQIEHDERYRIADEYMDVVYKLWEGSWRDDAVVKDLKTGQYAVPERVRQIHHEGKYFKVPGPHLCEPSPQRTPFLFQAGTSPSGRDFGAKHAEAIFVSGQDPAKVRKSVDAIRQLAKDKYGRDPSHVKVILGMIIIVAETDAAAEAKMEEMRPYGDRDGALAMFGGWTGIDLSQYPDDADFRFSGPSQIQGFVNNWAAEVPGSNNLKWTKSTIADYLMMGGLGAKACGSPKTVVDELERWMELADIDGFNLGHIINPGSFEDIIEFVLPELQSRGLFRTGVEKAGATTREVFFGEGGGFLLGDHPGRKFRWNPCE